MKHLLKIVCFVIIFVILTVSFSNSYTRVNLDNIAVVVSMGIDKGENNKLKVCFQFTNPSSISESGSSETASTILKSVDASSISSAINSMNSYLGKELTLAHCKLVVFSEELAKEGISDIIYTLMNDAQTRPSCNVVVSKCTAEHYINNSKPFLEPLISKYYELFISSNQFTGYTSNATLGKFFDNMICQSCDPFAILGGINLQLPDTSPEALTNKETSDKSNSASLSGDTISENVGLAVFREGALVGELNAIETLSFMCIGNEVKGFLISVPNPQVENQNVDVYLTPKANTKIDVSLVNGSPYIRVDCKYYGQIYSMTNDSNYLDPEILSRISEACNRYLEYIFTEYLYKTAKEYKSDINAIGKSSLKLFTTVDEYETYGWREHYQDSFFDVSAQVNVRSSSLLSDS